MNPTLQQSTSSMVKTGIWDDAEFVESHSIEDIFLLLFLLTNADRHLSGIQKLNPRLVTARTKWEKNQVQIVLHRLQELGDVMLDGQFVWVRGYFDHNHAPAPTHFKQIRDRLSEVSEPLQREWILDARERGLSAELVNTFLSKDTPSIPYRHPNHTLPGNNNNNDNLGCNQNNNYNQGSSGCGFVLEWPENTHPWRDSVEPLLAGMDPVTAQQLIDELSVGLDEKDPIEKPAGWCKWAIENGFRRTLKGKALGRARARKAAGLAGEGEPYRVPGVAATQKLINSWGPSSNSPG